MGSHHVHGAGGEDFAVGRRALAWLLAVLVPLLVATVVGMVMLWPSSTPPVARQVTTAGDVSQDVYGAKVVSTSAQECEGSSGDRLPDGSIPATVLCASAAVQISSGPDEGESVTVQIPAQVYRAGVSPGDSIQVARYPGSLLSGEDSGDAADTGADVGTTPPAALPDGTVYAWNDFSRGFPLVLLAVAFSVLVVAVGRLRGLAAVIGLGLGYLAVVKFMLPALRLGENPVAVALIGSVAVMTVVLYLAHGVSAKTTAALLGTIFGLALTAGLADWASTVGHLNGLSSEENYTLAQLTGSSDLSGVILCGIIMAGLGVLNDVTITQASAVWEVRAHAPQLGFGKLFVSGMRVGRDHLASTVYTIAFAYAGAALPTLILIDLYHQPLGQVLTSGQIAEEIVRTLVGAIGLVLAIPLTTGVAAAVVASSPGAGGVSVGGVSVGSVGIGSSGSGAPGSGVSGSGVSGSRLSESGALEPGKWNGSRSGRRRRDDANDYRAAPSREPGADRSAAPYSGAQGSGGHEFGGHEPGVQEPGGQKSGGWDSDGWDSGGWDSGGWESPGREPGNP
ncbi:hypothetical protein GCM10022223_66430 [Kineosporia mesophila]|uniref:YibE/F family protein n=1 Tax=Kineosporia mesophila TaxID=566012 RepID=A0ABP7AR50_9ACTN|nr:YibE/F family protein [Kineosporia mesophila]MCD5349111.1 YibE/F family protein [Kineosporia mesophila]